jgi:hypothetical protein
LSTALEEEEFYSAASIAKMDNDIAAGVVKAACLRAGTAQDFTNARVDLQTGSGGSGPPVHLVLATLRHVAAPFWMAWSVCKTQISEPPEPLLAPAGPETLATRPTYATRDAATRAVPP